MRMFWGILCFGQTLVAVSAVMGGPEESQDQVGTVRKLQGQICEGAALEAVSNGCVSADVCRETALSMGLSLGNEEKAWPFEGNWPDKGCIYYSSDHPLYPNEAYFGTNGTCSQLRIAPSEGGLRISCDGSTQPPFDPSRCMGEYCITADDCAAAALNMGLSLGNDQYPFEGDWTIKGCHVYPPTHPQFPGEAYWGDGASICGQLRADPQDGSTRLLCAAGGDSPLVVPAPEESEPVSTPLPQNLDEVVLTSAPQPEDGLATTGAPTFSSEEPQSVVTPAPRPVVTPVPAPVPASRPVPVPVNVTANDWNVSAPVEPPAEMPPMDSAGGIDVDMEVDGEVEAPAISPGFPNMNDKDQKGNMDKNSMGKDEDDEDDFDVSLGVSRVEGQEVISAATSASGIHEFIGILAVLLAGAVL